MLEQALKITAGSHQDAILEASDVAVYGTVEAAWCLRIPYQTLRYWTVGSSSMKPIVLLASTSPPLLSFKNLVECFVLESIRRIHRVRVPRVRRAVETLRRRYRSRHPLADHDPQTDGYDLFIEERGENLINLSRGGQAAMPEILRMFLRRVERDNSGIARKLYPMITRRCVEAISDEPTLVVIDPTVSFGRPVLTGTGIATAVIASRLNAGESVAALTQEYGRTTEEIEAAVRYEPQPLAA